MFFKKKTQRKTPGTETPKEDIKETSVLERVKRLTDEELKRMNENELIELKKLLEKEEREEWNRIAEERGIDANDEKQADSYFKIGEELNKEYEPQWKRVFDILNNQKYYKLKYEYEKAEREKEPGIRFMVEDLENAYQKYHRLVDRILVRIEIMKKRLEKFKEKIKESTEDSSGIMSLLVKEYDYLVKNYGITNLLEFVYENPDKAIEIAENLQGDIEDLVNQLKAQKPEAEKKKAEILKKIEEVEKQIESQIERIEKAKEYQVQRILQDSNEIQKLKEENKRLTKQLDQLIAENPQAEAIRLLWKRVQGLSEMVGVLVETQQTSITMQDLMRKMQAKMMGKEIEFTPYEKKAMLAKDVKEFKSAITGKDEQIEKVESEARKQINSLKKMKDRVLSVLKKELEEVEDQIAVIMYLPAIEKGKNITDLNKRYLNYYKKLLKRMDKASKQQLKYEMERLTKYYKIMHYNLDQIKDYHHFTEDEIKELVLTFAVAIELMMAKYPYHEARVKKFVDYIYDEFDITAKVPDLEKIPITIEHLYLDTLKAFGVEIDHLELKTIENRDAPRIHTLLRYAFTAGLMVNRIAEHVIKVMELANKKPFELPVLKEKIYKKFKDQKAIRMQDDVTIEEVFKSHLKEFYGADYSEQVLKEFFLGVLPTTYPKWGFRPYWERPIEQNGKYWEKEFTEKLLLNHIYPFYTPPDDIKLENKEIEEELKKRGIIEKSKGAER